MAAKIHPLADVQSTQIGDHTTVWQFSVVLAKASIGNNCNINCHCFIENDVLIGDNVTVKSGVYIWDGITVEDDVFIGPNATFVNDMYPRSKQYPDKFDRTTLKKKSSIGANATILGGLTIGEYAIIGAGSVVTKSVPAHAIMVGNPAKIIGWADEKGEKLTKKEANQFTNTAGDQFVLDANNKLTRL